MSDQIPSTLYGCGFSDESGNLIDFTFQISGLNTWTDSTDNRYILVHNSNSIYYIYFQSNPIYYSYNLLGIWKVISNFGGYFSGNICNGYISTNSCNSNIVEKLISKLDTSTQDMSSVALSIANQDYSSALEQWKIIIINRLKQMSFGLLGSRLGHLNIGNPSSLTVADFLVGNISLQQYDPINTQNFLDIYGISGNPDTDDNINWLAKLSQSIYENNEINTFRSRYGTLSFLVPLIYKYWSENDIIFGKKYKNILVDFCLNQKSLMETLPNSQREGDNASWTIPYGGFPLHQSDRIEFIIKTLAIFSKIQEYTPPVNSGPGSLNAPWLNILNSTPALSDPSSVTILSAEDLAAIALSLSQAHVWGIYNYYINQGIFNQRVSALCSLLSIVCVFPELYGMNELKGYLESSLSEILTNHIYKDGGYTEHSFNYNLRTHEKLENIILTLNSSPVTLESTTKNILENKDLFNTRLIESLRTPTWDLPVVGNISFNPTNIWSNQTIRNSWFNAKNPNINIYIDDVIKDIGTKNFTSIAFPYSGYYIQRKNWEWNSPYLFFNNSRPINNREMANNLSIELYSYGRQLLVNGGPPPYDLVYVREEQRSDFDKINYYFSEKSTYKTNSIIVNGLNQIKYYESISSDAYSTPIQSKWHTSSDFDYMEGTYSYGYGEEYRVPIVNVNHTRKIIFLRNLNCWIVVDIIKNNSEISRDYSQIWKFPPYGNGPWSTGPFCYGFSEEQVTSDSNGIHTSDPNGPNLYIYQFSNISNLSYVKYYGQTDEPTGSSYRGWYARGLGDAIPAVDMYANWSGSGDFIIASLLVPTENNNAPNFSSINHIPHSGDATKVSFEMEYNSKIIKFSASTDQTELNCGNISGECDTLLTIEQTDINTGLVLNSNNLNINGSIVPNTNNSIEFSFDETIIKINDIFEINKFDWINNNNQITPDYFDAPIPTPTPTPIPSIVYGCNFIDFIGNPINFKFEYSVSEGVWFDMYDSNYMLFYNNNESKYYIYYLISANNIYQTSNNLLGSWTYSSDFGGHTETELSNGYMSLSDCFVQETSTPTPTPTPTPTTIQSEDYPILVLKKIDTNNCRDSIFHNNSCDNKPENLTKKIQFITNIYRRKQKKIDKLYCDDSTINYDQNFSWVFYDKIITEITSTWRLDKSIDMCTYINNETYPNDDVINHMQKVKKVIEKAKNDNLSSNEKIIKSSPCYRNNSNIFINPKTVKLQETIVRYDVVSVSICSGDCSCEINDNAINNEINV